MIDMAVHNAGTLEITRKKYPGFNVIHVSAETPNGLVMVRFFTSENGLDHIVFHSSETESGCELGA